MVNRTSDHWTTTKRALRYLKGTIDFGHIYEKGVKDIKINGCSDSDFVGDVDDRKSTSGQVFFLGGLPITWNSLKQKVVALSWCQAEYISITSVMCQRLWIARTLKHTIISLEITPNMGESSSNM